MTHDGRVDGEADDGGLLVGRFSERLHIETEAAYDDGDSRRGGLRLRRGYERKTPLKIEDVDLDPPKAGEVLVKVAANDGCHSEYLVIH